MGAVILADVADRQGVKDGEFRGARALRF